MSQFGTSGGGGGGSIVTSITGNTGGPQTGDINLITANSTPIFAGSAGTITLDFALTTNLLLGSSGSITSGQQNVSVGAFSQGGVTSGNTNSSLGVFSLFKLKTGFDNLALGQRAGFNLSTNESRNILLANDGVAGESNTIRIGTRPFQTTAYIAGIDGVDLSTATIVTESADQLGTAVLTAGSGITITPGAGVITIDATGGGGAGTITGNTGGPQAQSAGNWDIKTANSTVLFDGAASTLTLDFSPTNLMLGSSGVSITTAVRNVAGGLLSGDSLVDGTDNAFWGDEAGRSATDSSYNVAIGGQALLNVGASATNNTAIGYLALSTAPDSIVNNVAVGSYALYQLGSGASSNVAIGVSAGVNFTSTESNNICIQNQGFAADNGVIRIGSNGNHTTCFVAGINGNDLSTANVVTESGDQLGTATLIGGSGITITPGAGTLVFDATGGAGITTLVADDGASSSGAVINLIGFDGIHTQSNAAANFNFVLRAPGTRNLYLGEGAGITGTSAGANICLGAFSMTSISGGSENIICGDSAARALVSGAGNSCFGCVTMPSVVSGLYNCNFGFEAGTNNTGSDSSNINIGYTANGAAGVSNRLMIGGGTGAADGQLSSAFIFGIRGITTGVADGIPVLVDSANQLGTVSSSIRFKENIQDMNEVSAKILDLRPVTFNLKKDSEKHMRLGLIAEEVKEVMPVLVANDENGRPLSVMYHDLPVLLLNELKKALKRIEILESKLTK